MSIGSVAATVGIIGGTTAIGAGASLIGAGKQADAAEKATAAQLEAHREGLAFQKQTADRAFGLFEKSRADFEPFRLAQLRAMGALEGLTDPNSPVYAAERKSLYDPIQKELNAQGLLRSGAQGAALGNVELGLSQKRAQILSMLAGTGAGATALSAGQNQGQQLLGTGERVGSSIAQTGAIQGQGFLNSANAFSQGLAGVNNAFQGGVGNAIQLAMLSRLFPAKVA